MANQPLDGIRVLDFTWAWAGPFCTLQLAHLGAEVIRAECTLRPCVTRFLPPFADDVAGHNRAGYFNQYNQGKKSILMNLAKPETIDLACELVRHCDVVTDNFAAGVMQKLGLGYDKLRKFRPDLIQISMSGYGQTGPFKGFVGYGPPASAAAGLFFGTGYRDLDPAEVGISYPDPNAGIFGAFAILTALNQHAMTGEGQYIDQSQLEAVLALMPEGLLQYEMNQREPVRAGNRDTLMSPHECYRASGEDKWVSIAVGAEDEWRALSSVMGDPK
jgi:benzylsuccinate CoA-transferase BbsF subunit